MLSASVITSQPVAAIQICFSFEKLTGHWWWYPQMVRKDGNGPEKLGERRVFRVQPIISRFPHHVAREHVIAFIKGKRFSMHDCQRQGCLNYEQSYRREPEVFWALIGHWPIIEIAPI